MKTSFIYKSGKIVAERSFWKVVINPICRIFGFEIATIVVNGKSVGYSERRFPSKKQKLPFDFIAVVSEFSPKED